MRLIAGTWALALALLPATARAEWFEASSAHFVVYADDSESRVRRFSDDLERYHSALAKVTNGSPALPSPSNRVTVYVVGSVRKVQKLAGGKSQEIGGFYIGRAGGSLAIVPRISLESSDQEGLDFSMITLLHEYAHHFMLSQSAFAVPPWVAEGGAEFFASASFDRDGTVGLGRTALHRAGELLYGPNITVRQLLDPAEYERRSARGEFDSYYGRAWLLYHYLTLGGKRDGQLQRYLLAMAHGKSSIDAGQEAFGPLDKLDGELGAYLQRSRIMMIKLPPSTLTIAPISLRRLGEGEAAIMPVMVRSRRGVDHAAAAEVVTDARAVAARFPTDAAVQTALAEAEHDAGNDDAAIAAADRALAVDRTRVNAYVQKGYALFRRASKSGNPDDFIKARAPFVALNRIENDHPLALEYYYRSFPLAGRPPTQLAKDGLERAVQVAPFDLGLRMTLAMQELRDGHTDWAKANLSPVAFNPHGGGMAKLASRVLARIDAEPTWRGQGVEPANEDDERHGPATPK